MTGSSCSRAGRGPQRRQRPDGTPGRAAAHRDPPAAPTLCTNRTTQWDVADVVTRSRWRRVLAARRSTDLAYRFCVLVIGGVLVVAGLLLVPLPGPGWLTVITGLLVLATEFPWARRPLRLTKTQLTRWTTWVMRQPPSLRVVLAAGSTALTVALAALALHLLAGPTWLPT